MPAVLRAHQLFCNLPAESHIIEGYALTRDTDLKTLLLAELEAKSVEANMAAISCSLDDPENCEMCGS